MKAIHPWVRNVFITGCLLSLIAGVQLFMFSTHTDLYFAWTIRSPLTAATLGAFYFGTMAFGGLSARETQWDHVKAPTAGLFAFLISWSQYLLTLLVGSGRVITLPILLFSSASGSNNTTIAVQALMFTAPTLLLLIFTSRVLARNALTGLARL